MDLIFRRPIKLHLVQHCSRRPLRKYFLDLSLHQLESNLLVMRILLIKLMARPTMSPKTRVCLKRVLLYM